MGTQTFNSSDFYILFVQGDFFSHEEKKGFHIWTVVMRPVANELSIKVASWLSQVCVKCEGEERKFIQNILKIINVYVQ